MSSFYFLIVLFYCCSKSENITCDSSCGGNWVTIECTEANEPCFIFCSGVDSCKDAYIKGDSSTSFTLLCSNSNACGPSIITCSPGVFCSVTCTSGNSCTGAKINASLASGFYYSCNGNCPPSSDIQTPPPSNVPTIFPSTNPTIPSLIPTHGPTIHPTKIPSSNPTVSTLIPSLFPSMIPTLATISPTSQPSILPSNLPTNTPTILPSNHPSIYPSIEPSMFPTPHPTNSPSILPTIIPTAVPITDQPTYFGETSSPTIDPSMNPTLQPSMYPTIKPTTDPSMYPTMEYPTSYPTNIPIISSEPTFDPTSDPLLSPTYSPTKMPTNGTIDGQISGGSKNADSSLFINIGIVISIGLCFAVVGYFIIHHRRKLRAESDFDDMHREKYNKEINYMLDDMKVDVLSSMSTNELHANTLGSVTTNSNIAMRMLVYQQNEQKMESMKHMLAGNANKQVNNEIISSESNIVLEEGVTDDKGSNVSVADLNVEEDSNSSSDISVIGGIMTDDGDQKPAYSYKVPAGVLGEDEFEEHEKINNTENETVDDVVFQSETLGYNTNIHESEEGISDSNASNAETDEEYDSDDDVMAGYNTIGGDMDGDENENDDEENENDDDDDELLDEDFVTIGQNIVQEDY